MSRTDHHPSRTAPGPGSSAPPRSDVRRLAAVGAAGAALTVASGAFVALVVQPRSDVADTQFSFPWAAGPLVPVSLVYAVLHLMVLAGIVALLRSGLAGPTRTARAGGALAAAGAVLLTLAELASTAVRDQAMTDTGAGLVGAVFGLATAVSMVGFLLLGLATLRAGRWTGWGRVTPLLVGVALVALMGLVMTPALAAGVGAYGLAMLVMFTAVATYGRG